MKEKLIKSINDIRILLTNNYDEAKIKQTVILRLLSELGWDFFDVNEVIPEYTVSSKRVDYCLKIGDKIKVFIEAKNSSQELTNHQNQLLEYSFQEGIELSILTNGSIWWFYLPLQSGHWTKRRFITLDIRNQDAEFIVTNFIKYLAKENIKNSSAYDNALIQLQNNDASESIQEILIKTWNKLVIETDALLVTLIQNKAHELYLQKPNNNAVYDFLDKNKMDLILQENYSSKQPSKTQFTATQNTVGVIDVTMSDAYVEYGFFPAKYLKNYIPQNSSKEKPFIVNFFGKEDVECYSDQPSRIKLKKGKEIFKKYKVVTTSIIQFDVSKLNEGLKIINIK